MFIGYPLEYKGYLCYNMSSGKILLSRHVLFDETSFPFSTFLPISPLPSVPSAPQHTLPLSLLFPPSVPHSCCDDMVDIPYNNISSSPCVDVCTITGSETTLPADPQTTHIASNNHSSVDCVSNASVINQHLMQTRGKSGISKRKVFMTTVKVLVLIPIQNLHPTLKLLDILCGSML